MILTRISLFLVLQYPKSFCFLLYIIQSLRALRQAREQAFQKKLSPSNNFPTNNLNGEQINGKMHTSRYAGCLGPKRVPLRVHFEPQVRPKNVSKLLQDHPLTPPGGWKNEVVEKMRCIQKTRKRDTMCERSLPTDPLGQRDGSKTARKRPREP